LKEASAFYGVGERCVAIESLRFLALTTMQLRGAIEKLAPRSGFFFTKTKNKKV
jgi:hypothetical protein